MPSIGLGEAGRAEGPLVFLAHRESSQAQLRGLAEACSASVHAAVAGLCDAGQVIPMCSSPVSPCASLTVQAHIRAPKHRATLCYGVLMPRR